MASRGAPLLDTVAAEARALWSRAVNDRDPAVIVALAATALLLIVSLIMWSAAPETQEDAKDEPAAAKRPVPEPAVTPTAQTPKNNAKAAKESSPPTVASPTSPGTMARRGSLRSGSLVKPGKFLGDATKKKKTFDLVRVDDTTLVLKHGLDPGPDGSPTRAVKDFHLGRESGAQAHPGTNFFTVYQLASTPIHGHNLKLEAESEAARDEWVKAINDAIKELKVA